MALRFRSAPQGGDNAHVNLGTPSGLLNIGWGSFLVLVYVNVSAVDQVYFSQGSVGLFNLASNQIGFRLDITTTGTAYQMRSNNDIFSTGTWKWVACTWRVAGATGESVIYHAGLTGALTEATYMNRNVGTGTILTNNATATIFLTDAAGGQNITLAAWAIWKDQTLTLAQFERQRQSMTPVVGTPSAFYSIGERVDLVSGSIMDRTTNGNHGTIVNTPLWAVHPPLAIQPSYLGDRSLMIEETIPTYFPFSDRYDPW